MSDLTQKQAAVKFVKEWTGRGQEDEDCQILARLNAKTYSTLTRSRATRKI